MNRAKLEQCLWQRVRLRPIAKRMTPAGEWETQIDDEWIPVRLGDEGIQLQNVRTQHVPIIGYDQIHHYMSDPNNKVNGVMHGFLELNVQLVLTGLDVLYEPIRPHRPRRRS
jgi:hypothetical protein